MKTRILKKLTKSSTPNKRIDNIRAAKKGGNLRLRRRWRCMKRHASPRSPAFILLFDFQKKALAMWNKHLEQKICLEFS